MLFSSLQGANATKQSMLQFRGNMDCFAGARNDEVAASKDHSPKQRPVIRQNHARGVVAGGAGDAAAGMGAAAAMVEPLQRPPIIGVAAHWPRREQLIERQRAVKNIAAEQPELALQIERREDLPAHDACRKTRRITIYRRDHEIGDLIAMVVPR